MRVIIAIWMILSTTIVYAQNITMDSESSHVVLDVQNAVQIEWKPDSSKLAILTGETIEVWNTERWDLLFIITDAYAYDIDWHPTDDLIAGINCCDSEKISIWNGETGELQATFSRELPKDVKPPAILSAIAWHPNGRYIASDSFTNLISIWHVQSTSPTSLIQFEDATLQNIVELSWSITGKYLLSANVEGTIDLWDGQDGDHLLQVDGYKHIAWNADEVHFAGASFGNIIQIWNVETETLKSELFGHTHTITSINWNSLENLLSSTDADGNLIIWQGDTGTRINIETTEDRFVTIATWRPDGSQLAISTHDSVYVLTW